jgi:hypothetical protein
MVCSHELNDGNPVGTCGLNGSVCPGEDDCPEGRCGGKKYDGGKLRYDLVPWDAMDEVVKRFTYGAAKYAPDNWKKVPDAEARYKAALMRHFSAYCQDEDWDSDSGLSHIGAVAWNALVLVYFWLHPDEA